MKSMKRIIALLMAVLMLAALTACGNKIDVDQYEQPKAEEKPAASATESAPADGAAPAEGETAAAPAELSYAEGTVLRMATGYNSAKTGLFFDAEVAGEGVTLANGQTYNAGDLKPTWVYVCRSCRSYSRSTAEDSSVPTGRRTRGSLIFPISRRPPA